MLDRVDRLYLCSVNEPTIKPRLDLDNVLVICMPFLSAVITCVLCCASQ